MSSNNETRFIVMFYDEDGEILYIKASLRISNFFVYDTEHGTKIAR